jgi:delta 1-pyrroline-5-carboxylate dehydrogenase
MGGGGIRVLHEVDVQVSHFALLGGHGAKLGDEVASPGAPTIRIRLVSIMGGTDVARGRKRTRAERRRERELRKAERRELER